MLSPLDVLKRQLTLPTDRILGARITLLSTGLLLRHWAGMYRDPPRPGDEEVREHRDRQIHGDGTAGGGSKR